MNLCPDFGVRWLFLDLNSYFASCEQQEFPDLRNEPVIVVPFDSNATCAIAASYEAKRLGIKTGTNVGDARSICPKLRVIPARHDVYRHYHEKVIEEVIKHTPIRKVWSIDELESPLSENHRTKEAAEGLALRIKEGLRRNVGECIRASIGLAPNSFLGKVATDMQKPNGLVTLEGHNMLDRLSTLSLRDLPGIGKNMEIRLKRGGIFTVRDLWNCDPKRARKVWGGVGGERFWYNLHGVEVPTLPTTRGMIGHSRVLDPEFRGHDAAYQIARRLTAKAVQRMRREGFMATGFSLSVKSVDRVRWGIDFRMPETDAVQEILTVLDHLWTGVGAYVPDRLLQVCVNLHGLIAITESTGDLFNQPTPEEIKRRPGIDQAIEKINKKHGAQTINFGMIPALRGAAIGTKIAFSRIPDSAEFEE